MNKAQKEAIANADAHLSNAGLPSYSEAIAVMSYLLRQARLSDLPESNQAIQKSEAWLIKSCGSAN